MNTQTFDSRKEPRRNKYLRIMAGVTFAGILFSGYLSAVNLFSGSCAFNETCPTFLGYPACFYGFGMFTTMFGVTVASLFGKIDSAGTTKVVTGVSLIGIVFAGHFVWADLATWLAAPQTRYELVLPTCVYGLVFYVIIFVSSLMVLKKKAPLVRNECS